MSMFSNCFLKSYAYPRILVLLSALVREASLVCSGRWLLQTLILGQSDENNLPNVCLYTGHLHSLREHSEGGREENTARKSQKMGGLVWNAVFWAWDGHCTRELTAVHAHQHSLIGRGGAHEVLFPGVLLELNGRWLFPSVAFLLISCPHSGN